MRCLDFVFDREDRKGKRASGKKGMWKGDESQSREMRVTLGFPLLLLGKAPAPKNNLPEADELARIRGVFFQGSCSSYHAVLYGNSTAMTSLTGHFATRRAASLAVRVGLEQSFAQGILAALGQIYTTRYRTVKISRA